MCVSYFTNKIDDKIIEHLKCGSVGFLPTDTIYGLSTTAANEKAVKKVHNLKNRDQKPFIILISNLGQLADLGINRAEAHLVEKYWPGPLSVIFGSANVPEWLQMGTKSLAVRLPASKILCDLIAKIGPIVSTSANLQGQEPARNVEEAKKYFGEKLDFYVDVGEISGQSSTLVKIENDKLQVIRRGAYKLNF